MTNYYPIPREEFENELAAFGDFEVAKVRNTREIVYDLPTESDRYVVRVFSTLDTRSDGTARKSGSDAIRVVVWDRIKDRPVRSATRTHRIPTWASNFAPKVADMFEQADELAAEFEEVEAGVSDVRADLPEASDAENEIVVGDDVPTQYGLKVALQSPYAAKDAIKTLDWETTHRAWDKDMKAWTVDADALANVRDALRASGWELVRPAEDDEDDGFDATAFADDAIVGETVVVTYETKNAGTEKSVEGYVTRVSDDRVIFRRSKDDHTMWVSDEGLFTRGSHYPFVGSVIDATVVA